MYYNTNHFFNIIDKYYDFENNDYFACANKKITIQILEIDYCMFLFANF